MAMIQITVKDHQTDAILGEVQLPAFCVDHMRMTPPEVNLATMVKHIEMRCPVKIGDIFVAGQKRNGLSADEIGQGLTLHVVTVS
jgi:hypothetical protein